MAINRDSETRLDEDPATRRSADYLKPPKVVAKNASNLLRSGVGVCLATTASEPGGVWRYMSDLADGLLSRGVRVRIELPADATRLKQDAENRGFCVGLARFEHEIYHFQLSHTFDLLATVKLMKARAAGARVILTEHLPRTGASDPSVATRKPRPGASLLKSAFKRIQFALTDRVIAVSPSSANFLVQRYDIAPPKLVIIMNGIKLPQRPGPTGPIWNESYPELVAVGALIEQKGYDMLIAAGDLAEEDWRVDVYGTGAHLNYLKQMAAHQKLRDGRSRIVFHGWSDEAQAAMAASDGLVMPSRWESLGYSALEAMSWGKPVVGTAVDGLVDVVLPGVTGLLTSPEPHALASALDGFSRRRTEASAMGLRGYERVKREFDVSNMVSRTIEVYEGLPPGQVRA